MSIANNCSCEVCSSLNPKYKCPNCFIKYCSVNCWKQHQNLQCTKKTENSVINEENISTAYRSHSVLFPIDDTIPTNVLEKLGCNKELKNILSNPALQRIIEEVDKSSNAKNILRQAMLEPLFMEFVDMCLDIVEPCEDEGFQST